MADRRRELVVELAAGGVAGIVSDGVMHPVDTVRTLLMAQRDGKRSTLQMFRETRGLYRGFGVVREAVPLLHSSLSSFQVASLSLPAHAAYFMAYTEAKRLFGGDSTVSHLAAGLIADVAGSLFWVGYMRMPDTRLFAELGHC
jgi:hypothetical protein